MQTCQPGLRGTVMWAGWRKHTNTVWNTTCYLIPSSDLVEQSEAGKVHGPLKEIAAGRTDDDNPVLAIVRFKN